MPRIVHTADLHFDTPYAVRLSRKQAALRRSELKFTFSTIVERAKEADLLLIAGDLFDGPMVSQDTIAFLKRKLAEIPDIPVCIAAGNHDPYTADSVYAREAFSSNVHVFGRELAYIDFPHIKTRVHGVSFTSEAVPETLLHSLACAEDYVNILVMHGDVNPAGGESRYNPLTEKQLAACGADYAALGHVHTYQGIHTAGSCTWAYPGNPEGRGFDETGEKGILEGVVEKNRADLAFRAVCRRKYYDLSLDISEAVDEARICEQIQALLAASGTEQDLYRIALYGRPDTALGVRTEVLQEALADKAFYLELSDQTEPPYDFAALAKEQSLRGRFVQLMQERIDKASGDEKEVAVRALRMGVEALGQS